MKSDDKYTKGVLTVIAVSLVTLCVQNSIGNAVASNGVQKIQICDSGGYYCATVSNGRRLLVED